MRRTLVTPLVPVTSQEHTSGMLLLSLSSSDITAETYVWVAGELEKAKNVITSIRQRGFNHFLGCNHFVFAQPDIGNVALLISMKH